MNKLFDTHAHYFDDRFNEECNEGVNALLSKLFAADLGYVINVGTNNQTSHMCIDMAKKYPGMYAAVGIHPDECMDTQKSAIEFFESFFLEKRNLKNEKIVAIGEIGLDYHLQQYDKELQRFFFEEQMRLAEKYNLPVIVHDRDAHGDCLDVVNKFKTVKGVFHSYSGSMEMAVELVKKGWYISFSGVFTFRNSTRLKEVAKKIPVDRILVETDCPYLAPEPMRGKLNHSGYLHYIVEALSKLFDIPYFSMTAILTDNAKYLFKI